MQSSDPGRSISQYFSIRKLPSGFRTERATRSQVGPSKSWRDLSGAAQRFVEPQSEMFFGLIHMCMQPKSTCTYLKPMLYVGAQSGGVVANGPPSRTSFSYLRLRFRARFGLTLPRERRYCCFARMVSTQRESTGTACVLPQRGTWHWPGGCSMEWIHRTCFLMMGSLTRRNRDLISSHV